MPNITPLLWTRTGNDYVRDGLTGRLGSPKEFGDTLITGAINTSANKRLGNDQSVFYAGSVNGGLYSRLYNEQTDSWSEEWIWESEPGSGYDGGQSIGSIAISEDGKYLAVGRGNPSNYNAIGTAPYGIQIARIKSDGSLAWLQTDPSIREAISSLPIKSLEWSRTSLITTTTGAVLDISVKNGEIKEVAAPLELPSEFSAERMPDNSAAVAGYFWDQDQQLSNGIVLQREGQTIPLSGETYADYIRSVNADGSFISKISAYPKLINGNGVFFVGSFTQDNEGNSWVSRIDRIRIDLDSGKVKKINSSPIPRGLIGNNQAANNYFYGNFSFSVDPFDPRGRSVFAGGNTFGSSPGSQALTYSGGLVRIRLKGGSQENREAIESISYLYGPRLENNKDVLLPPAPGQPHADSRSISFYHGQDSAKLIQTDDGGIWSIDLQLSARGAKLKKGEWWMPLTPDHNGFQGLEVNMVDWASNANIIASSYQDNAASLGYFGDPSATNLWAGDGEIAIIDDGGDSKTSPTAYLSAQQYLGYGSMSQYSYDEEGYLKGMQPVYFSLSTEDGSILPWDKTPEVAYYDKHGQGSIPFLAPIEENPYASNKIIMAGSVNAYETIDSGMNKLIFRPLLKDNQTSGITFTALDNTSKLGNDDEIGSVYLAGRSSEGQEMIYGRQKKTLVPAEDPKADIYLSPIEFTNLTESQLSDYGAIIDISHRPSGSDQDILYILQGGMSLLGFIGSQSDPSQEPRQYLHIGSASQSVKTFSLEQLGLPVLAGDAGYQSSVYIPANHQHGEKLVIGGLAGVWISDLDEEGMPLGFEAMDWQGLDEGIAPGSYVRTIKYEPQDDLLVLGTLGQGNWLYSFSGNLGDRPKASKLLHMSNTSLVQGTEPDLDKRGNQFNQAITIQLDGRLQSTTEATDVEIILHNKDKWRRYMSMVSPYNVSEDGNLAENSSAREKADRWYSILRPFGLHYRGGRETKNSIIMPFSFNPGISMFNLSINAKDFYHADPAKLRYSVRTTDGSESVTRTLSLIGEFEDLEENGSDLPSSALRAADTPDEITRYTKAQKYLSSFENIASESVAYTSQLLGQESASEILSFDNSFPSNLINPFAADLSLLH